MEKSKLQEIRDNIRNYQLFEKEHKRLSKELNRFPVVELSLSNIGGGSFHVYDKLVHKAKMRYEEILQQVLSIYIYAVEEHPNNRDVAILTCFIDGGMGTSDICEHLSVERTTIYRSLNRIIKGYYNNSQKNTH